MQVFHIAGAADKVTQREVHVTLDLLPYKGAVRVVAVNPTTGKRIKNGNLAKIVPGEGIYLYDTIASELGMPTDDQGRLVLLDENPHS